MAGWRLTDEIRKEYKPIFEEWLNRLESIAEKEADELENHELGLNLTDMKISPWQTRELLLELGFTEGSDGDELQSNGWQMDFWLKLIAPDDRKFCGDAQILIISGCAMTFELKLWFEDWDY